MGTVSSQGVVVFLSAIFALWATPVSASNEAGPKPTITTSSVTHLNFKSSKSFAEITAAIEKQLGKFDPGIGASLAAPPANPAEIEAKIHAMEGSSGLMIFAVRDHGQLLALKGRQASGRQYVIGNPLVALEMTQHNLVAGEYAPVRLYVYVGEDKLTHIDYDLPSSIFGRFKSSKIDEVAKSLDEKLERLVANALKD
jgi:uncharacterized protein (DUF302 family)